MEPLELSPVEKVALTKAYVGKALNAAKAALPANSNQQVDFNVRIFGNVARGADTPESSYETRREVKIGEHTLLAVLHYCRIGQKRVAEALKYVGDVDDKHPAVVKLAPLVRAREAELTAKQPLVKVTTEGKAGDVTASINVEVLA
jgi:hypothetical protein